MNLSKILEENKYVILYFYAEWCVPCKNVSPIMDRIATEYEGKLKLVKINSEDEPDLVTEYGIRNVPGIFFIKDGKIFNKHFGFINTTALYNNVIDLMS